VLARIVGLFSARGYNIDSLTVADVSGDQAVSRITVVTNGPPPVIDQIIAQLDRLVPVHRSRPHRAGPHVEREMALVKVAGKGAQRDEALRIADIFRARPVDTTTGQFRLRSLGPTAKVDQFIALMREFGLVEVARTGVVAIARGAEAV
jgi:acetolactate synthase I/III small subunit